MDTELEFNIPEFFRIHRGTEVTSAAATPNDTYSQLNLDVELKANYLVYTNTGTGDQLVTITAACPQTGEAASAFTGTAKATYYMIFGNADRKPDATSIAAAKSPTATKLGSDNPNAIKIKMVPTVTKKQYSASGVNSDTEVTATTINGDKIVYTLGNGQYDFSFLCAKQAEANTFSTADTLGDYQATITITKGGSV